MIDMPALRYLGAAILTLIAVVAVALSVTTLSEEYNDAVHGGKNMSYNANASAAICLRVSRGKAEIARDSIAAAITLNTLLIGVVALIGVRAASCIASVACNRKLLPERAQQVCNVILMLLFVLLSIILFVVLYHIDKSCSKLAWSLGALVLVIPVACLPACCLCAARDPLFDKQELTVDLNTTPPWRK